MSTQYVRERSWRLGCAAKHAVNRVGFPLRLTAQQCHGALAESRTLPDTESQEGQALAVTGRPRTQALGAGSDRVGLVYGPYQLHRALLRFHDYLVKAGIRRGCSGFQHPSDPW